MNLQIVTDSTSDIPADVLSRLPITQVPLYIMMEGQSYRDNLDLTREDFYKLLPTADPLPTTAAPSPEQFMSVYDQLADEGADAIFSIHISETLSAVFQSVRTAAEQYTRIPVHAIDSGTLSMAEGLIVITAAEAVVDGKSEAEILELINALIPRAHAYAKLDTIDYLKKGGRMSSIQHSVVSILGIKPILKMSNHVSRMEIARTKTKAFEKVLHTAEEKIPYAEKFGITHAAVPDQVDTLIRKLKTLFPSMPEPLVSEVTPALGTHVGPGALCINWIESKAYADSEKKGWRQWLSEITQG
jgi:DegV family protein with EDD domain